MKAIIAIFFTGTFVCGIIIARSVSRAAQSAQTTSDRLDQYVERLIDAQNKSDMSTSWPTGDSVRTIRTPVHVGWSPEQWRNAHFEEVKTWQKECPPTPPKILGGFSEAPHPSVVNGQVPLGG